MVASKIMRNDLIQYMYNIGDLWNSGSPSGGHSVRSEQSCAIQAAAPLRDGSRPEEHNPASRE